MLQNVIKKVTELWITVFHISDQCYFSMRYCYSCYEYFEIKKKKIDIMWKWQKKNKITKNFY